MYDWMIIEIASNTIDILIIFFLLCRKFESKFKTILPTVCFILLGIISECVPIFVTWKYYSVEATGILVCIVFLLICRKGSIWRKVFWIMLIFALIFAIGFTLLPILSFFSGENSQTMMIISSTASRIQYLVIVHTVKFIIFYMISINKKRVNVNPRSLILCFIVPLISTISGIFIYEIYLADVNNAIPNQLSYFISSSYLLINLIVFALYEIITKEAEKNYILLSKQKQYELIEEHNTQIDQIYSDIRDWQHDFKHHMQVIHTFIERSEIDEAEKYLKNLDEQILMSSIKVSTGNYLVDAILSSKMTLAKAYDIKFECNAILPVELSVDNTDLCAILSNLLDNAIEACRKVENKKYIKCDTLLLKNQLYIKIVNASNGKYVKNAQSFITTKKDGKIHGLGLNHVESIVSQYDGICKIKGENECFTVEISIPINIKI
jgi:Signal transduction histidine kinase regulating citrate/malate metabolism